MNDWIYVPQMIWSLWCLIDGVRTGHIGPWGLAAYIAIFTLLLLAMPGFCRRRSEREAKEERRQRDREERAAALPPWPWRSK